LICPYGHVSGLACVLALALISVALVGKTSPDAAAAQADAGGGLDALVWVRPDEGDAVWVGVSIRGIVSRARIARSAESLAEGWGGTAWNLEVHTERPHRSSRHGPSTEASVLVAHAGLFSQEGLQLDAIARAFRAFHRVDIMVTDVTLPVHTGPATWHTPAGTYTLVQQQPGLYRVDVLPITALRGSPDAAPSGIVATAHAPAERQRSGRLVLILLATTILLLVCVPAVYFATVRRTSTGRRTR
jgi:hypothetical protein